MHPSAWKDHSTKSGYLIGPGLIHVLGSLCTTTTCSPPTPREWPQKPSSRLSEGDLYKIVQANFAESLFRDCPKRGTSNAPSVYLAGIRSTK
jgi:hypothetical protein